MVVACATFLPISVIDALSSSHAAATVCTLEDASDDAAAARLTSPMVPSEMPRIPATRIRMSTLARPRDRPHRRDDQQADGGHAHQAESEARSDQPELQRQRARQCAPLPLAILVRCSKRAIGDA